MELASGRAGAFPFFHCPSIERIYRFVADQGRQKGQGAVGMVRRTGDRFVVLSDVCHRQGTGRTARAGAYPFDLDRHHLVDSVARDHRQTAVAPVLEIDAVQAVTVVRLCVVSPRRMRGQSLQSLPAVAQFSFLTSCMIIWYWNFLNR